MACRRPGLLPGSSSDMQSLTAALHGVQVGAGCVATEAEALRVCQDLARMLGSTTAKPAQSYRSLEGAHCHSSCPCSTKMHHHGQACPELLLPGGCQLTQQLLIDLEHT